MAWDPEAHRRKVALRQYADKCKEKSYWPYFRACSVCGAPESKQCWNLYDVRSKSRSDPKYWSFNANAHTGRVKMTREEYEARREELFLQQRKEHKEYVAKIQKILEDEYGL